MSRRMIIGRRRLLQAGLTAGLTAGMLAGGGLIAPLATPSIARAETAEPLGALSPVNFRRRPVCGSVTM